MKTICEIKCEKCGKTSPSQIQFGDAKSFFATATSGNTEDCPYCGHITPCNKDNMRFRTDDGNGHVIYEEGKDAL